MKKGGEKEINLNRKGVQRKISSRTVTLALVLVMGGIKVHSRRGSSSLPVMSPGSINNSLESAKWEVLSAFQIKGALELAWTVE